MTRERMEWLVVLVLLGFLLTWIARNTYWTHTQIPTPLKGEAATNPFYILERFSQALGARTHWNRGISLPPDNGVVFISALNWDLSVERRQRMEHWVESGGRLVVDGSLINSTDSFEKWSGIGQQKNKLLPKTKDGFVVPAEFCYTLEEQGGGAHEPYSVCGMDVTHSLTSSRKIDWALRSQESGLQTVRVRVGRGSVTELNGTPFTGRGLFSADNGLMFVAATQLRRGDEIHFFSESHQASLLALAWQLGWPVICLVGIVLALAIWRSSVRFGPLAAPTETARRSLAEQIRGTGQFTMRIGSGGALHAAAARALNEAAARHINAYEFLPGTQRMQALAKVTGYEASSLAAALNYSGSSRAEHLRSALELLEAARRRILLTHTRSRHGN